MKVLHVIPSVSKKLGGPTEVIRSTIRGLQEIDIDAEVLTSDHDVDGVISVPTDGSIVDRDGVPTRFFPRGAVQWNEFMVSRQMMWWLYKNVKRYDIIDFHYLFSFSTTLGALIARMAKVPYTVRAMGQLAPWCLMQSKTKKSWYLKLFELNTLKHASFVQCTTDGERDDVLAVIEKVTSEVIPIGVIRPTPLNNPTKELREKLKIPADAQILLFISRIHEKKRPDIALEAFARISKDHPNLYFVVAGSGDDKYQQSLKDYVANNGIQQKVLFVGFVEELFKELLLQGSDFFILPSFTDNFAVAVGEALARGLPVIVSSGIQISSLIGDYSAGIVVKGDAGAYADAIVRMMNLELREKSSTGGKRLIDDHFSVGATSQLLSKCYTRYLSNQKGGF